MSKETCTDKCVDLCVDTSVRMRGDMRVGAIEDVPASVAMSIDRYGRVYTCQPHTRTGTGTCSKSLTMQAITM